MCSHASHTAHSHPNPLALGATTTFSIDKELLEKDCFRSSFLVCLLEDVTETTFFHGHEPPGSTEETRDHL